MRFVTRVFAIFLMTASCSLYIGCAPEDSKKGMDKTEASGDKDMADKADGMKKDGSAAK